MRNPHPCRAQQGDAPEPFDEEKINQAWPQKTYLDREVAAQAFMEAIRRDCPVHYKIGDGRYYGPGTLILAGIIGFVFGLFLLFCFFWFHAKSLGMTFPAIFMMTISTFNLLLGYKDMKAFKEEKKRISKLERKFGQRFLS